MDDAASLTATSTILKCALPAILYSGELRAREKEIVGAKEGRGVIQIEN
jgi:hypothetical protein